MLALPDFNKKFVLKLDACAIGLGAALGHEGRPLTFLNKALKMRHLGLFFYKKKYLAVLMAVYKWRHYLKQEQSITQIDHESLKYLLDQKIHSTIQKKGLIKFFGLNY